MTGELSPASVYVSLLPVVEACVVVAVPGRVGEVRVAADEPEAVDLDPGVLARRLDAPATVKAVLEQGGRVLLRGRAVCDPGREGPTPGCTPRCSSVHPGVWSTPGVLREYFWSTFQILFDFSGDPEKFINNDAREYFLSTFQALHL